jgi:hypothetical protein
LSLSEFMTSLFLITIILLFRHFEA